MPLWEYAILTRMSAGLDTKWYLNRTYQHSETDLPEEVTGPEFKAYNQHFDELHASKVYPILPAVLNLLGADGWELIDDMATGMTGGEGLVFKREIQAPRRSPARATRAAKTSRAAKTGRSNGKSSTKKTAAKRR